MKNTLVTSFVTVIIVSSMFRMASNFIPIEQKIESSKIIQPIQKEVPKIKENIKIQTSNTPKKDPVKLIKKQVLVMEKIGATKNNQEMVDYALKISNYDKDFVLMLEAESKFNPKAYNINKDKSKDLGIAQINVYWHPKIVKDPRYAKDWKFQIDKGYELYKSGTTFYGYYVRKKVTSRFKIYKKDVIMASISN